MLVLKGEDAEIAEAEAEAEEKEEGGAEEVVVRWWSADDMVPSFSSPSSFAAEAFSSSPSSTAAPAPAPACDPGHTLPNSSIASNRQTSPGRQTLLKTAAKAATTTIAKNDEVSTSIKRRDPTSAR